MKFTKFFIIFTLLLIFALQVSAQDKMPKIVWKNLQEKYESFYKIEALVVNESNLVVYYDTYFLPLIDLERFDEKSNSWKITQVWHCGTGYKPHIKKIKSMEQIPIKIIQSDWDEMINDDSIGVPKFRRYPEYNGIGKFRFIFRFGIKKSNANQLVSYSPEFEVIEKDFKK